MYKLDKWNKKDYNELLNYLKSIGDNNYIAFSKKIIPGNFKILGVRIPILKKIAKQITSGNYISFLNIVKSDYIEELFIEGFVIGNIKEEAIFDNYVDQFIKKIKNWSVCDSCISSFKIIKKNKTKYFDLVLKYSKSNNEFEVRASLIMLLSFYCYRDYAPKIFKIIKSINIDYYYVNMAKAWLLCELFIKCREETLSFIKNNKLDSFTKKKFIMKCMDSYRIDQKDKIMLKNI